MTDDLGADLDQLLAQLVNDHGSAVFGNGMPYHVTLLDAAGLEVEAWAVDGDGRFQMAEVAVPRQMFAEILSLIARLQAPPSPLG